jgi:hypothetical protein
MSALAPIADGASPPTQPRIDAALSMSSSSSDDSTNRARRALFGT